MNTSKQLCNNSKKKYKSNNFIDYKMIKKNYLKRNYWEQINQSTTLILKEQWSRSEKPIKSMDELFW